MKDKDKSLEEAWIFAVKDGIIDLMRIIFHGSYRFRFHPAIMKT